MTHPDRDTAAYTLNYATNGAEGLPTPDFFTDFMFLLDSADSEQQDRLSLSYPHYVAAYRLALTAEGLDLLRQLAHPQQL